MRIANEERKLIKINLKKEKNHSMKNDIKCRRVLK